MEEAAMSATEALRAARALGVELAIDGNDLLLEPASEPPAAVLDELSRYKAEIVALLRGGRDGWSAEDWLLFFEERAGIAEFDAGLPRTEADARALACCIAEWLNRNPTPSAPGRCAWCGQAESNDAVVLPNGVEPGTHIWLHAECWPAWQEVRRSQAREALARMGIGDLSDGRIVTGGCGHPSNKHRQQ
jgi:sugar phosphate isomerase/epimerase